MDEEKLDPLQRVLDRLEGALERKDLQGFTDYGKYRRELLDGIRALRLRCEELEAELAKIREVSRG